MSYPHNELQGIVDYLERDVEDYDPEFDYDDDDEDTED